VVTNSRAAMAKRNAYLEMFATHFWASAKYAGVPVRYAVTMVHVALDFSVKLAGVPQYPQKTQAQLPPISQVKLHPLNQVELPLMNQVELPLMSQVELPLINQVESTPMNQVLYNFF